MDGIVCRGRNCLGSGRLLPVNLPDEMKTPPRFITFSAALATITLATPAFAVVNMNWTSIGNPGNASDTLAGYGSYRYGAVSYSSHGERVVQGGVLQRNHLDVLTVSRRSE